MADYYARFTAGRLPHTSTGSTDEEEEGGAAVLERLRRLPTAARRRGSRVEQGTGKGFADNNTSAPLNNTNITHSAAASGGNPKNRTSKGKQAKGKSKAKSKTTNTNSESTCSSKRSTTPDDLLPPSTRPPVTNMESEHDPSLSPQDSFFPGPLSSVFTDKIVFTDTNNNNSNVELAVPSDIHIVLGRTSGLSPETDVALDKNVARFDKDIVTVLDEMCGSLAVFRQQVTSFVENQLQCRDDIPRGQLKQLVTFLSLLIPNINKFRSSSLSLKQIPKDELKQNFGKISDVVSAIHSFAVHHLHYAPNINASDMYGWILEGPNREQLVKTTQHFTDLLRVIEKSVDSLISLKIIIKN